jgi:formate dehydrogenase maturation protein FdhE
MDIDDNLREDFLENPRYCPFCGSMEISEIGSKHLEGIIMVRVKCDHCQIAWTEEYKLFDIKNARSE